MLSLATGAPSHLGCRLVGVGNSDLASVECNHFSRHRDPAANQSEVLVVSAAVGDPVIHYV